MADVKELIPEFFYLPEFMVNSSRFDLGKLDNSVKHITCSVGYLSCNLFIRYSRYS